jgi:hypothetical protein
MVRVRGLSMELWKYPVLRDALAGGDASGKLRGKV